MREASELDAIGRKLIGLLRRNAREPISSLARKLQLSRSAVHERITRLESNGTIAGYTVRLGQRPADDVSAYFLINIGNATCSRIAGELETLPEVRHCQSLSGDMELLVTVRTKSVYELEAVRSKMADIGAITDIWTAVVLQDYFDR